MYTLIRVGREGGSYYLEQCMYVCMYGRDPSFKIYNGDTSDDEILFCWARRRRRRTRGGKTEDGKVRNRKKRERDFGNWNSVVVECGLFPRPPPPPPPPD